MVVSSFYHVRKTVQALFCFRWTRLVQLVKWLHDTQRDNGWGFTVRAGV